MKRAALEDIGNAQKYSTWTRAEMQKALKERKLKAVGSNIELRKRLLENDGCDPNNNGCDPNNNEVGKENSLKKGPKPSNVKAPRSPLKPEIEKKLKELGAKISGNKPELKERLQLWEKYDLGRTLITCDVVPSSTKDYFPGEDFFRPLFQLPRSEVQQLTLEVINCWFLTRSAIGSRDKGRKLFFSKYLKNVRVSFLDPKRLYFKSECASACSKKEEYTVQISLGVVTDELEILQAHCQCVAGDGLSAACKHVAALSFCIEHYACCGDIIQFTACTSTLQGWHQPPAPGRNLQPATVSQLLNDPLPQIVNSQKSTVDFLNFLINGSCPSAVLHSRSVNASAYFHDYSSLTKVPLEFSIMEKINSVTTADVIRIEKLTRKQSGSKLWYMTRSSRLTASVAGDIVRTVINGNFAPCYGKNQIEVKDLSNVPAIKWGQTHEKEAILMYEKVMNIKTEKTGIYIDQSNSFVAASPDARAHDSLIEVKCPWSVRNGKPTDANFFTHSIVNGKIVHSLKRNHKYFMQCQIQMHVTGTRHLDFVAWTPKGIFIESISYNAKLCEKAMKALDQYYKQVFCAMYLETKWARDSIYK